MVTNVAKFNIPEGRDPAEFLNDAELAEYHARRYAAALEEDPDDPALPELRATARAARRAAAETAGTIADATEAAEAELAKAAE